MRDSIEGCTQIKENKDGDKTRVGSHKEIIDDFKKSSFCTLVGTEARLELFVKVI